MKPGTADRDEMVARFRAHARQKTERPDSLRDFVLTRVDADMTVLDIGAGTGRWTIPIASAVRQVTAAEPAAAMEEMLCTAVSDAGLHNVDIVSSAWEELRVEPHDAVVAAHSMYTSPDLAGFVRTMERCARGTCYMELRIPSTDGIVGELTSLIHGRFHDSPNAVIAYNALHAMGIYANVLVEDDVKHWTDGTFDEAFARAKGHLRLDSSAAHDDLVRDVLVRRLTRTDAGYRWPDGKRSALLWWSPSAANRTTPG